MNADTKSPWRRAARERIEAVLAAAADASPTARRKAVRDAYPFGERKGHPYRMWLLEQRIALGPRPKKPSPPPMVRIRLERRPVSLGGNVVFRRPWLAVKCGWCNDQEMLVSRSSTGENACSERVPCLMCAAAFEAMARFVALPHWRHLQRAAADGDETALAACRDFALDAGLNLEENVP